MQIAMKTLGPAQLFLLVTFLAPTTADHEDCPPWFLPHADNGTGCVCSSTHSSQVKCGKDTALLSIGNCVTYNRVMEVIEMGPCPYISQHFKLHSAHFSSSYQCTPTIWLASCVDHFIEKVCYVGSVRRVLVQYFTPIHWSARSAGGMVLGGFFISPLQLYQQQFYTLLLLFSMSVLLLHH